MRSLILILAVVILGCLPLGSVAAYTAFDEVVEVGPTWTALPAVGVVIPADRIAYRVRVLGIDRIAVDLRNRDAMPVSVLVDLPQYQARGQAVTIRAEPGATATVEMSTGRTDRACTEAAVRFLRVDVGGAFVPLRRFPVPGPWIDRAYALATTWEAVGFRASAVAYAVRQEGPQYLDVRLLNRSGQPIHGDIALPGWQTPGCVLPRVHLLPGVFTDVLIPTTGNQPRVGAAALAMWAVRVGADTGPSLGQGPADTTVLPPMPSDAGDWQSAGWGNSELAGFNPRTISYRLEADGVVFHSRSPLSLTARAMFLGGSVPISQDIALPTVGAVRMALPADHGSGVVIYDVKIAGELLRVEPLTIAPPPVNAMPVMPQVEEPRFNALTIVAQVVALGSNQAKVHIVNRSAIAWHADWSLPAYQTPDQVATNPRLHLESGAATVVVAAITNADVRLPLAQVVVRNIRLGEDAGALWCAP